MDIPVNYGYTSIQQHRGINMRDVSTSRQNQSRSCTYSTHIDTPVFGGFAYEQTVRIWEEHLNRPEDTKGSRDLAWFHVRYLSSRSSEVFELVTWGSRVPVKFVNRVQMTRFPGGIGFPLTFAGAHRVKEPGQRPSNQTLYRRLSFTTRVEEIFGDKRILELRGVSPTAARVKPGASSGFCDDWTVRTLTPTWGMPQHRAVDPCGASAMLDTFKSDPWVSNVCHNWFPVLPSQ